MYHKMIASIQQKYHKQFHTSWKTKRINAIDSNTNIQVVKKNFTELLHNPH